jgi:hypothetical protein
MSEKQMVLHASTDTVGSECTVELGYSENEWKRLTKEEQQNTIDEMMGNLVDTWIEAE